MDSLEIEKLIKQDEENGNAFDAFLDKVYTDNKQYFDNRTDRYKHLNTCFALLSNKRPPYYRLRYVEASKLDESIKSMVVNKYKELFDKYADYQII